MELVNQLMQSLGVTQAQAQGGAGLLFKVAKDKLGGADFAKLAGAIPGIDQMMSAAPEPKGAGGMLSGVLSAVDGDLGSVAKLAGGFSALGLDKEMVGKFIPLVLQFVQGKGGDKLKDLLAGVLS